MKFSLIRSIDFLISLLVIICLLPVFIVNAVVCIARLKPVFSKQNNSSDSKASAVPYVWNNTLMDESAGLINVARGDIGLMGMPVAASISSGGYIRKSEFRYGLISPYEACQRVGMVGMSEGEFLNNWFANLTVGSYLQSIFQYTFTKVFYSGGVHSEVVEKPRFNLMGVDIDNMKAVDAVNKICKSRMGQTQVGYFINVNSINLAWSSSSMMTNLNNSDFNLADGSGVRLGAQRQGVKLLDNNNGTDLLPLLCKKLAKEGKAIYMLGAKPGVALKAAINLQEAYPGLLIAGTRDGYFSDDENSDVVESINKSLASVVLVAMGSPRQEAWIAENSDKLNVDTVLAVGGLFDFFSGNIPRSPEFLRLIGAEWLFRLYQEPLTKFKRYVVGNPIYLWRLYTS